MCGRYYVDDDTARQVRDMVRNKEHKVQTGDVRPSEPATVLSCSGSDLLAEEQTWGFLGCQGKLLINARAETITERPAFRDSFRSSRCVIPAKGFYEWSPKKEKYSFEDSEGPLFLAGCMNQGRFVIITTAANASVSPVHERMPLLIRGEEIKDWITDDGCAAMILARIPQQLCGRTDYHQLSLFD